MEHFVVYCVACGRHLGTVDERSVIVRQGKRCEHIGFDVELTRDRLREAVKRHVARVEAQGVLC